MLPTTPICVVVLLAVFLASTAVARRCAWRQWKTPIHCRDPDAIAAEKHAAAELAAFLSR